MARKKQEQNGSTDPEDHADAEGTELQTNKGARADRLCNGFDAMLEHDRAIEAAIVRYVQPLKDARKKDWRDLRKDLDMSGTDLNLHYKLWKRAQDAQEFDDEGERDTVLDNLREIYEALSDGGQLDFLGALPGEGGTPADTSADFLNGEEAGSA